MSEIKVNKISPKQLCTQLTLGDSGDTIIIPAGATITNNGTATGFGRTGTVNWDTTPKTTSPVTAVSGNGYFINTTSIAITINLPATPSAGDIVAISDYANTSATNNITVGRNGSLIDGSAVDAKIKVNGQVYTLVYIDATEGWKTVGQTFNQISTAAFVAATGGTITTCGDYKIHSFTGPGTFTVTNAGNPSGSTTVDYLVVAGGGGGGATITGAGGGGGGGAGGFRESVPSPAAWTASPLASPGGALPVSVQGYPITVGAGGSGGPQPGSCGSNGNPSIFSTITSTAGGYGAAGKSSTTNGGPGGSGGGGGSDGPADTGGSGNTPPVSPPQGNKGGDNSSGVAGAGGGGATQAATNITPVNASTPPAMAGGAGATTSISGSPTSYAGGGGGGAYLQNPGGASGAGGAGGGGAGGFNPINGVSGTTNTGGGGGGGGMNSPAAGSGASGGSGIVIIRYKFQ
jgi:hypothetical protein